MFSMIPLHTNRSMANRNAVPSLWDDRFFNSFFDMGDMFGTSAFRVDVKEGKDAYELSAELPGVKQNDIELTVDGGTLTIAANMNSEQKEERQNYVYSERRTGRFQRSFDLTGVREEGIEARYEDGVLRVTLPKESVQEADKAPRRIEIR